MPSPVSRVSTSTSPTEAVSSSLLLKNVNVVLLISRRSNRGCAD